jgi:hypothetical protein
VGAYDTGAFATTGTTLASASPNPSVYGQTITFTATVASTSGVGTPTGTVGFYHGSTKLRSAALTLVNGQDQASFSTGALPAGLDSITASYAGDSNFAASASTALMQTVNEAPLTVAADDVSRSGYRQPPPPLHSSGPVWPDDLFVASRGRRTPLRPRQQQEQDVHLLEGPPLAPHPLCKEQERDDDQADQ